jgi:hypothetical protein
VGPLLQGRARFRRLSGTTARPAVIASIDGPDHLVHSCVVCVVCVSCVVSCVVCRACSVPTTIASSSRTAISRTAPTPRTRRATSRRCNEHQARYRLLFTYRVACACAVVCVCVCAVACACVRSD